MPINKEKGKCIKCKAFGVKAADRKRPANEVQGPCGKATGPGGPALVWGTDGCAKGFEPTE